MGIETKEALAVTCDNPDCPGNTPDPSERKGWLIQTSEIYGESIEQNVFCGWKCSAAHSLARDAQ